MSSEEPRVLSDANTGAVSEALVDHLRENHRLAVVGSLTWKFVHAMNNTLTMVKANLSDIRQGLAEGESGEIAREALEEVSQAAEVLEAGTRAMNEFLQGAREREPVDLAIALDTAFTLLEPKIRYSTNLKLCSTERPPVIEASPTHMIQVFSAILLHVDARPSQYGPLEVTWATGKKGCSVEMIDMRPAGIVAHVPDGSHPETGLDPEVGMLLAQHIVSDLAGSLQVDIPEQDVTRYRIAFPTGLQTDGSS